MCVYSAKTRLLTWSLELIISFSTRMLRLLWILHHKRLFRSHYTVWMCTFSVLTVTVLPITDEPKASAASNNSSTRVSLSVATAPASSARSSVDPRKS